MKSFRTIATLFVIILATSGCTNLNQTVLQRPILPVFGQDGTNWLHQINALTNLKSLGRENALPTDHTDIIANADGTTYSVTVSYRDRKDVTRDAFDPGAAITKVFTLGDWIMHLEQSDTSGRNPFGATWIFRSDVKELLTLADQMRDFRNFNYQAKLNSQIHDLLEDQLSTVSIKQTKDLEIHISLDAILAAYLKAYLQGTYVDRWGRPISQPDMTKIGNDTAGAFTKVMLDGFFDYSLMTPIVHDPNRSSTNKTPTFALIFPQLYECVSTNSDAPGVTQSELEALNYLSGLSDEGAKHLSSLIVKSVGGASIGVKISSGDNSTFSQIISTLCEELSRRTSEEISYRFFEHFQYYPSTNSWGYEPRVEANNRNLFKMDASVQEAVVALLVSQDNLKNLLNGGWKLTTNNIINYEALAAKLVNTNDVLSAHLYGMLSQVAQRTVSNKGDGNNNKSQILTDALNQMVQNSHDIYQPADFPNIVLSPETQSLLKQNPQGIDRVHLNWLLLLDAFSAEISKTPANN